MKALRFFILALPLTLVACADEPRLMEKSSLATNTRMQLVESRHVVKDRLAAMTPAVVTDAAGLYQRSGAGPMYVVIAYNDQGKTGDAAIAAKRAEIAMTLADQGIEPKDVIMSTVPLTTSEPVALIAFNTLSAQGPANCTTMPGYDAPGGNPEDFDYALGCTVKSVMARQIADPRDLEGKAGLGGVNDGERAANVVSRYYRPGETQDFLPSYIIAELGGGGG